MTVWRKEMKCKFGKKSRKSIDIECRFKKKSGKRTEVKGGCRRRLCVVKIGKMIRRGE